MSTISTIAEAPDKTPVQNDSTPWQQVVRRLAESRIAPFVVIALLVALAGSGYLFFSGPKATTLLGIGPSDSSYTALAYARSLVEDQHIGFSPISNSSTTNGPSWTVLLSLLHPIAGMFSISSMLLVKIAGLVLLFFAAAAVFNIAKITSKTNWLALVAITPLVLEPRFVYAVVGGTEHALLAAAIAWLIVFRLRRQERRTSIAAAVAVGIWPIGALVFVCYTIDVIRRIRWSAPTTDPDSRVSHRQLRLLRTRIVPPAIVFIVVGAITSFADGGLLPSTFALQAHPFDFTDWSNMWTIITEYLSAYSAFDTPLFIASIAIILIGNAAIWRRTGAVSAILLPTCLAYLYFLSGWREMNSPAFFQWNLVALIWPLIAIPLGVGMTQVLTLAITSNAGRNVADQLGEPMARILPAVGVVLLLLGISSGWPTGWRELPPAYHEASLATRTLMIEPAEWLNENGSPGDVVIAVQANAIRNTLNHGSVYDLTGGGSPDIIRRPVNFATLKEFDADWIIIWDDDAARAVPELDFEQGFSQISGPEYPLDHIAVWRAILDLTDVPPDVFQSVRLEGLQLLGSFDIGDPQSEIETGYTGGEGRFVYEWASSYGRGARLTESYSLQPVGGFDRFTLPASPNTPAVLAIRYDRTRIGALSISANGVDLGVVQLGPSSSPDAIVTVSVPASLVTANVIEFEVGYETASAGELAILRYWSFAADESSVGRGPLVRVPTSAEQLVLSDSFTDLDNIETGLHFPDSARVATSWRVDGGNWRIVQGQVQESLGLNQDARLVIEAPGAREISFDVVWRNSPVGLIFGYVDPQNWSMYYFFPDVQGFHDMRFGVMNNGIFTVTGAASVTNREQGDTLTIGIRINEDGTVSGFLDGSPAAVMPQGGVNIDATLIGMMSRGTGNTFDNFVAHELR
ncbi:MAG: hypothetical protein IIA53_09590 [Chloroflexi bacterium]|nr:hypothetical protein [Chloroflexota bacterium]